MSANYPLAGLAENIYLTAAGQLIYTAAPPSNPLGTIIACWDANANAPVWSSPVPAGQQMPSGIAVDETRGMVFVATVVGSVLAFDLATGTLQWSQRVGGQIGFNCVGLWRGNVVVIATHGSGLAVVTLTLNAGGSPTLTTFAEFPNSAPDQLAVNMAIDDTTNTVVGFLETDGGPTAFAYNLATAQWPWYESLPAGISFFTAAGGGRFYVPAGNTLYALDALAGTTVWTFQARAPIFAALFLPASLAGGTDSVYFGSSDGNLYDINATTGIQKWVNPVTVVVPGTTESIEIQSLVFSPTDNQLYFVGLNEPLANLGCVGMIDPTSDGGISYAAPLWGHSANTQLGGPSGYNLMAYVPTSLANVSQNDVSVLNVVDFTWTGGLDVDVAASNSDAATSGADVTITLPSRNGLPQANAPVTVWSPGEMTISANGATYTVSADQNAVLTTDSEGTLKIAASSDGVLFASIAATPPGGWINIPISANGSLASAEPPRKGSTRSTAPSRIKQITIESELIVGTYDQTSPTLSPQNAQYQMHMKLVDRFGNPRANYGVTCSSVDVCAITAGGAQYSIGPTQPQTLTTDAAGFLSLVMTAPTRVTLPALSLQCAFMGAASVTVNVDVTATSQMGTMTAEHLDPATAVAYDGNPLLSPDYQDIGNRTAVAQAFQNTMGGQQLFNARFFSDNPFVQTSRANGVQFIPASLAGVAASATSGWQIGPIPNFSFGFSAAGPMSFNPLTPDEAQAHFDRIVQAGGIFGDFLDFVENVWNGIESVTQMVVQTVENVSTFLVNTIVNGVEAAYSFVVTTLQQAGAAIASFMKTVAEDVERFIQFLSYLFDWDDFIATKNLIKSTCSANLAGFTQWWSSASASATLSINDYFAQLQGDISSIESSIVAALTGQGSAGGVNNSSNNPSAQFSGGGARSFAKTQWLSGKIQGGMQSSGAAALALGSSDPFADVIATFETFFTSTASTLASAIPTLATDVENVFTAFTGLMSSPEKFATTAIVDIVELLAGIAQTLLQAADAAAIGFLDIIGDLLNGVWSILNQPLDIPFVSWLYNLITGDTLTLLDAFALLVAIPATIVWKAISSSSDALAAGGSVNLVNVTYSLTLTVTTLFDGLNSLVDGSSWASPLAGALLALNFFSQLLTVPMKDFGGSEQWQDYLIWSFQCLPLIGGVLDYSTITKEANEFVTGTWEPNKGKIYCGYGIGMMSAFCIWAQEWPDTYSGTNYDFLIQNLFSVIMYPFKPLAGTGTEEFLTFATVVGDGVNAGMSFQYLTN
jgi:outer membrane protein assembly factor BamB